MDAVGAVGAVGAMDAVDAVDTMGAVDAVGAATPNGSDHINFKCTGPWAPYYRCGRVAGELHAHIANGAKRRKSDEVQMCKTHT